MIWRNDDLSGGLWAWCELSLPNIGGFVNVISISSSSHATYWPSIPRKFLVRLWNSQIGICLSHFLKAVTTFELLAQMLSLIFSLEQNFKHNTVTWFCRRRVFETFLHIGSSGRIALSNNLGVDDSRHAINLTASHLINPVQHPWPLITHLGLGNLWAPVLSRLSFLNCVLIRCYVLANITLDHVFLSHFNHWMSRNPQCSFLRISRKPNWAC